MMETTLYFKFHVMDIRVVRSIMSIAWTQRGSTAWRWSTYMDQINKVREQSLRGIRHTQVYYNLRTNKTNLVNVNPQKKS